MKNVLLLFFCVLSYIGNAQINVNEGFESGTLPSGWMFIPNGVVSSTTPIFGTYSVNFNVSVSSGAKDLLTADYTSTGNALAISFFSKELGTGFVTYEVLYKINNGSAVTVGYSSRAASTTSAYNTYNIPAGVIPSGTLVDISIRVGVDSGNVTNMYLDDVFITQTLLPVTAPTISSISSNTTSGSATINYSLNANTAATTSIIRYGNGNLLSSVTGFAASGSTTTPGSIPLTGLSASTVYSYRIEATNSAGTTQSSVGTFTTASAQLEFNNLTSAAITFNSATVSTTLANVCPNAMYHLQYSTSATFGSGTIDTVFSTGSTDGVKNHNLTNLLANTVYYFRFYASPNDACNATQIVSATASFTTVNLFSNLNASNIANTTATVSVTLPAVCNGASFRLQYSTSNTFGAGTVELLTAGIAAGVNSLNLTGLTANTAYYFRYYVAVNDACNATQIVSVTANFATTNTTPQLTFSNLTSSNLTTTTATVSVTLANVCVGSSYHLQYATAPTFDANVVDIFYSTSNSNGLKNHNLTGLAPNTTYYFRFYASINDACNTTQIVSVTASFTTPSIATQTAVAEYNFNGTLNNINGNSPFSTGASFTTDRNGNANQALNLTVAVSASIANLPISNAARTVSVWVRPANTSNDHVVFSYGLANNNLAYGFSIQPTTVNNFAWGSNDFGANIQLPVATWRHVVCTYNASGIASIYIDGALISSATRSTWNTSNSDFYLGKTPNGSISYSGLIDDLKIYNYALSQAEITNLYVNNTLSSTDFNQNDLKVALYPNPANDVLNIETDLEIKAIEIFNIQGQKVISSTQKQVNVTNLSSGIYMIKIQDSNNAIATKKFVKQ